MVCLLCDFKILLTVFNQSYNCQTSHYLGRNWLPKPFLILPSLHSTMIHYLKNKVEIEDCCQFTSPWCWIFFLNPELTIYKLPPVIDLLGPGRVYVKFNLYIYKPWFLQVDFWRGKLTYRISSYKTRGYYFFKRPSTAGIIRMRVLFEG